MSGTLVDDDATRIGDFAETLRKEGNVTPCEFSASVRRCHRFAQSRTPPVSGRQSTLEVFGEHIR
jgi:hypothetical protein